MMFFERLIIMAKMPHEMEWRLKTVNTAGLLLFIIATEACNIGARTMQTLPNKMA